MKREEKEAAKANEQISDEGKRGRGLRRTKQDMFGYD